MNWALNWRIEIIRKSLLVTYLLLTVTSATAEARGDGSRGPGGGGDLIVCKKSEDGGNHFEGLYSLDFVQTRAKWDNLTMTEHEFPGAESMSCENMLRGIQQRLQDIAPVLGTGLKYFTNSFFDNGKNKISEGDLRVWIPCVDKNQNCVGNIADEQETLAIPKNCAKFKDERPVEIDGNYVPNLVQFIARRQFNDPKKIEYIIDHSYLEQIANNPRQCSYSLIHEWARDFTPNTFNIKTFNAYLHSKAFFQNDNERALEDLKPYLTSYGSDFLNLPESIRKCGQIAKGSLEQSAEICPTKTMYEVMTRERYNTVLWRTNNPSVSDTSPSMNLSRVEKSSGQSGERVRFNVPLETASICRLRTTLEMLALKSFHKRKEELRRGLTEFALDELKNMCESKKISGEIRIYKSESTEPKTGCDDLSNFAGLRFTKDWPAVKDGKLSCFCEKNVADNYSYNLVLDGVCL